MSFFIILAKFQADVQLQAFVYRVFKILLVFQLKGKYVVVDVVVGNADAAIVVIHRDYKPPQLIFEFLV